MAEPAKKLLEPIKAGAGEPIRECLNCNKGCVDAIQGRRHISCVLNAENGDEATVAIEPGDGKKKVAVAGGGVAGLEAARVCARRGYDVTLYEAAERLGGQIHLAAAPPRKDEIMRAVEYYEKALPGLGVKVELNHPADAEDLNAADAAIVAVGAHDVAVPVPGADSEKVVSSWDVLAGAPRSPERSRSSAALWAPSAPSTCSRAAVRSPSSRCSTRSRRGSRPPSCPRSWRSSPRRALGST